MSKSDFPEVATVSHLPAHSADGYSFGGGTILTIGIRSFFIGEEHGSHMLAEEIARRWNVSVEPMYHALKLILDCAESGCIPIEILQPAINAVAKAEGRS